MILSPYPEIMRLIDTSTLTLHTFVDTPPKYAILSHRWQEDEISFQEFQSDSHDVREKPGYRKVVKAAEKASADGYQWLWVDTCCIDKTSSAELSEAINSMFRWYSNAKICYAYLFDVTEPSQLASSDWFSRG